MRMSLSTPVSDTSVTIRRLDTRTVIGTICSIGEELARDARGSLSEAI